MSVSGLQPVPLERFGGIDWRDDPDETKWNAAIDFLNVDLDPRGALSPRPAPALKFDTGAGFWPISFLPYVTSDASTVQWVTGPYSGGVVRTYSDSGTLLGSGAFANINVPLGMQTIGDPTGSRVYAGNGKDPIGYWDGAAWFINSTMASVDGVAGKPMPAGRLLAATPWDNRLAVAGFLTTTGGPGAGVASSSMSHIWFSEPANPTGSPASNVTDWKSKNFLVLTPADGEPIRAMVAWNNQLFIFKGTKFFVFYGVSTDATGNPIFNYRTVSAGVGVDTFTGSGFLATAGSDGVYFGHSSGIYRTSGGPPVRISDPIMAAFPPGGWGGAPFTPYYPNYPTGAATSYLPVFQLQDMAWMRDRLYVAYESGGSQYGMFVWDRALDAWMLWAMPAVETLRVFKDRLYCAKASTSGIFEIRKGNAENMSCVYQSAFSQLGQDAREKTVRETQVIARNAGGLDLQLGWAHDGASQIPSTYSLSQGTSGRFYQRRAEFGESLSWRLSATGTQDATSWMVQRVVAMLRESVQGKAR